MIFFLPKRVGDFILKERRFYIGLFVGQIGLSTGPIEAGIPSSHLTHVAHPHLAILLGVVPCL